MDEGNIVLRTNLFIMRELYWKLGTDGVSNQFIQRKGNRTYLVPFPDVLGVDKQRLGRILTSNSNSKITKDEQKKLGSEFSISPEYFSLGGDLLLCEDLPKEAWGVFFQNKYKSEKYNTYHAHYIQSKGSIVERVGGLCDMIIDNCSKGVYSYNDPLYRIWWYYKHGESISDDLNTIILRKIEQIEKTPAREWKEVSDECLHKSIKVFQKLLGNLQALDRCRKEGFIEKSKKNLK